jgi:hypothetical protein
MSNRSKLVASLTFAAPLAVATSAGAAEQDSKAADKDAKSQAELERKSPMRASVLTRPRVKWRTSASRCPTTWCRACRRSVA